MTFGVGPARARAGALVLAIVVAACGGPIPASPTTGRSSTGPSPSAVTGASPSPSGSPIPSDRSGPSPTSAGLDQCEAEPGQGGSADGVEIDAGLLALLPAEVEGIPLRPCPAAAVEIAADPGLATYLGAVAIAIAASLEDYAVVTLVRPIAVPIDVGWFRDWRDTFDAGVCERAGGVDTGHSEFEIGPTRVYRSTCVGDVVIHHATVGPSGIIVSVQGAGPRDLGRAIMAALEE